MWSKISFSIAAVVWAFDHQDLHLMQIGVEVKTLTDDAIQVGDRAPLSEDGYQWVASMKNDQEMEVFIERVAMAEARKITDAGALSGAAPYFSGTRGVQSLESLKTELRSASWVGDGEGRRVPLDENGYQAVVGTKNEAHMMAFARRILDAHGKQSSDEGMLKGLLPWFDGRQAVQSFAKLQSELLAATWVEPRIKSELSLAEHESTRPAEAQALKEDPENSTKVQVLNEDSETTEMQVPKEDSEKTNLADAEQKEGKQKDEKKEKEEVENEVLKKESKPEEEKKESKPEEEKMESKPEEEKKESKQEEEKKEVKNEATRTDEGSAGKEKKKSWFSWLKR